MGASTAHCGPEIHVKKRGQVALKDNLAPLNSLSLRRGNERTNRLGLPTSDSKIGKSFADSLWALPRERALRLGLA